MKAEIDFQSTNRFEMSLGIILITISIILGYFSGDLFVNFLSDRSSLLKFFSFIFSFVVFILYVYEGSFLVKKGYTGLKEFEGFEKKLKFEYMVKQILDQDLKLIDIKLKQFEYNEKVRLLNEKDKGISHGTKPLQEIQYRDIKNVVEQALNPNFYEDTYSDMIENSTEKRKKPDIHNKKENIENDEQKKQFAFSYLIVIISIAIGYFGNVLANYSFLYWQSYSPIWGFRIALIIFIFLFIVLIVLMYLVIKDRKYFKLL
ncbi:MAG: hypothetical protein KAT05_05100 [Spirochaetes bacterium]|nr:hypothetical protein [Spirochaetota bacterium]